MVQKRRTGFCAGHIIFWGGLQEVSEQVRLGAVSPAGQPRQEVRREVNPLPARLQADVLESPEEEKHEARCVGESGWVGWTRKKLVVVVSILVQCKLNKYKNTKRF